MFFTPENAEKADSIRIYIKELYEKEVIDINEYYHLGQRASGSLCYYGFNPKHKVWSNFVPPVTTRKFGKKYKEETGNAQALEKWFIEEQWWIDNKKDFV
jgi:hypothetical protein